MQNQRLVGGPFARPEDVVHWMGAVQSQDYGGAKWGIAQRTGDATSTDLDSAFDRGTILRTHVMRPTWHFVTPADIRWLLALTAPRVHALNAHYHRKLDLDGALLVRSQELIARALVGGKHRTRAELAAVLAAGGVVVSGVRLAFVLMRAELDGLICSGARRGKQFTYALLDERVPRAGPLARDEALAELARRYFTSHGPATSQDYAWWSGLSAADANAGIEAVRPRLEREAVGGKTYWSASSRSKRIAAHPVAHLLPNFDEYIVAYKDRSACFAPEDVAARDPLSSHSLVVDGLIVGAWRRTVGKKGVVIDSDLQVRLDRAAKAALRTAADRYGRFIGSPVILK